MNEDPKCLRKLLMDLLRVFPTVGCSELHHPKKDQHGDLEDCPVLARIKKAKAAAWKIFLETDK